MNENEISHKIIGASIELHKTLGPGLLENAYEKALAYDLKELGLIVDTQVPIDLVYKGLNIENAYKIDILVNDLVIIELKSVEALAPVYFAQTLTYLKLSGKKLGLLINFNTETLKNGIHRIVNKL